MRFRHLSEQERFPPVPGAPQKSEETEKKPHIIWRGLKVVIKFFFEIPLTILAVAVGGIACHILCPPFALPLFVVAGATVLSKLVVKILSALKWKFVETIERSAWKFNSKFPKLRLIAFIFTVALGYAIPIAGVVLGAALGAFNGLIIEVEQCKNRHNLKKKEYINTIYSEINILT